VTFDKAIARARRRRDDDERRASEESARAARARLEREEWLTRYDEAVAGFVTGMADAGNPGIVTARTGKALWSRTVRGWWVIESLNRRVPRLFLTCDGTLYSREWKSRGSGDPPRPAGLREVSDPIRIWSRSDGKERNVMSVDQVCDCLADTLVLYHEN
jgi:hypothetical protein